jgi:hypothetical protein
MTPAAVSRSAATLDRFDHVHVFVADRTVAVARYARVLGLAAPAVDASPSTASRFRCTSTTRTATPSS